MLIENVTKNYQFIKRLTQFLPRLKSGVSLGLLYNFSEDDPNSPLTRYHAALRKRWFIEYFKGNLFLGFQLKNIKSFDFTID